MPEKGWFPCAPLLLTAFLDTPSSTLPKHHRNAFPTDKHPEPPCHLSSSFTKMSIVQEAFLDPPCKINVAHSVLPLSALFFIAFIVPTSDKLSLCQLELEFKLPEGKGELPILFSVFPQGVDPCVEYRRCTSSVG